MNREIHYDVFRCFLIGCGCAFAAVSAEEICPTITSEAAYENILSCAERGDAQAQFLLAHYFQTQAQPPQYFDAMQWYLKSARQDYLEAQFQLGIMYLDGQGITEDSVEGFEWISRAALNGHEGAIEMFDYLMENPQPLEC